MLPSPAFINENSFTVFTIPYSISNQIQFSNNTFYQQLQPIPTSVTNNPILINNINKKIVKTAQTSVFKDKKEKLEDIFYQKYHIPQRKSIEVCLIH